MMKKLLTILAILICAVKINAQRTDVPMIGAQVFIEPGQSDAQIDTYFRRLSENGMKVARIRLFGAHVFSDGNEDFSLYDKAFDSAERYGIKLFVTLFPVTDELNDVGGFKFPKSKAHLAEIEDYVKKTVIHFKDHPALYAWVLQNEPGTGGTSVHRNDLSDMIHREWDADNPQEKRNGYLKEDFREMKFLRHYTAWYLNRIAQVVKSHDNEHYLHINPHALLSNLPEYDFRKYEDFLTSLGVSMHLSWHFGDFNRLQYPIGVSIMSDIIRERAGKNPFWITELQGGNVTASGYVPLCPTAEEIRKYIWTGIASGCEGIIFWTLNARKGVMEAGEWALLDYQDNPSDRMTAAKEVTKEAEAHKHLIKDARPSSGPVTVLYNDDALLIQRRNSESLRDNENEARKSGAVMRSIITSYEALCAFGPSPALCSMDYFDWNPKTHPAIVIPNIIAIPHKHHKALDNYVFNGGKVLVTGLSGFYDEHMQCLMMGKQPFAECFGGILSEVKVSGKEFTLECPEEIPAHLWRGIIKPTSETEILGRHGSDVCATRNRYGKGEVVWIPSLIHLGAYGKDNTALVRLYGEIFGKELSEAKTRFTKPQSGVLLRTCITHDDTFSVLINLTNEKKTLTVLSNGKKNRITLLPDEVTLLD